MSGPDNHDTGMQTTRTVSCPTCTGPSLYTPDNRFRPFCSERCKRVDLGAWASDSFRVADVTPFPDAEGSVH